MWALRILLKLMSARLPIPYKFWKSIRLFQHGQMDFARYVKKIFELRSLRITGLSKRY